jgi:murein DD-endopeptidase MepM/ murein hydrolase activator NlpD
MNSSSSGRWLERFFTGKGFYIVLFLCAAVIGVSAWMMAAGNGTMEEAAMPVSKTENPRVETVILPSQRDWSAVMEEAMDGTTQDASLEQNEIEEPAQEVFEEQPPVNPIYAWPVSGTVDRFHDAKNLSYDPTMRDWRTHEGIDILAPLGETVKAAHAGTVERIRQDDLFGTVVTVNHGDGVCTVYANLAEETAVRVGDWVEPGSVIGAIGASALAEISQESHLHFAVMVNGVNQNPLDYLPA